MPDTSSTGEPAKVKKKPVHKPPGRIMPHILDAQRPDKTWDADIMKHSLSSVIASYENGEYDFDGGNEGNIDATNVEAINKMLAAAGITAEVGAGKEFILFIRTKNY